MEILDQNSATLPPVWVRRKDAPSEGASRGLQFVLSDGSVLAGGPHVRRMIAVKDGIVAAGSFIFDDDGIKEALLQAAKSGARPYLLVASSQILKHIEDEDDESWGVERAVKHAALLRQLGDEVMVFEADNYHAKWILTRETDCFRGALITANLTTQALDRSPELGIELSPGECVDLFHVVRWAAWKGARHRKVGDALVPVLPLEELGSPPVPRLLAVTMGEGTGLRERVIMRLQEGAEPLIAFGYGWDVQEPAFQALLARCSRGPVEVLARPRATPKVLEAMASLVQAGARVFGVEDLHAKGICFLPRRGKGHGLVMTANWEHYGMGTGFEIGVEVDTARHDGVALVLHSWRDTAAWEFRAGARLEEFLPGTLLKTHLGREEVLVQVVPEVEFKSRQDLERIPRPLGSGWPAHVSMYSGKPERGRIHFELPLKVMVLPPPPPPAEVVPPGKEEQPRETDRGSKRTRGAG